MRRTIHGLKAVSLALLTGFGLTACGGSSPGTSGSAVNISDRESRTRQELGADFLNDSERAQKQQAFARDKMHKKSTNGLQGSNSIDSSGGSSDSGDRSFNSRRFSSTAGTPRGWQSSLLSTVISAVPTLLIAGATGIGDLFGGLFSGAKNLIFGDDEDEEKTDESANSDEEEDESESVSFRSASINENSAAQEQETTEDDQAESPASQQIVMEEYFGGLDESVVIDHSGTLTAKPEQRAFDPSSVELGITEEADTKVDANELCHISGGFSQDQSAWIQNVYNHAKGDR